MSLTDLLFRNRLEKAPVSFSEARKAYMARLREESNVPRPSTDSTIAAEWQLTASQLLGLMPIAKKSNVRTSIARPPPNVFEHRKLTPHELKTLIELEGWIPRKLLNLDTSPDATSSSNIFVVAKRLIQEGAERQEKVVEHVEERDGRDDRIKELGEKLRRFEESENTTMALGEDDGGHASRMITPRRSNSGSVKSASPFTTVASSVAANEESSVCSS